MLKAQAAFGPDGETLAEVGPVVLGRRIARLLPEDENDDRLVGTPDGRLTLVADVRLDNRDELCRDLHLGPSATRALSDAGVLLAAFERWDTGCLSRLLGDFAFAVWDAPGRRLVLARDFLGLRPLHLCRFRDGIAFASMPVGLHALPELRREPDEGRVAELVAGFGDAGPRSYFAGIERIEPAHFSTVTPDKITTTRYWDPQPRDTYHRNGTDYAEALRQHLDDATRARLRGAGRRVGAQLSGGLDSTSVAATAAQLLAGGGGTLTGFTSVPRPGVVDPDRRRQFVDEGPLAAAVAAMYPNIDHVLVPADGRWPLDELHRVLGFSDRPLVNMSNQVWVNAIFDGAGQRGIRVLLSGERGNFTISDNGTLGGLLLDAGLRRWQAEVRALARAGEASWARLVASTLMPFVPHPLRIRLPRRSMTSRKIVNVSPINPAWLPELDLGRSIWLTDPVAVGADRSGFLVRAQHAFDPGNERKAALGVWRIDVRDPTTDRRLVEFCLGVPVGELFRGGERRALARRAFADRLPAAVVHERRKGLQAVGWHEPLRRERERLTAVFERQATNPHVARVLDVPRLRAMLRSLPEGGWQRPEDADRYRAVFERGLSYGEFLCQASKDAA
jgi:asparagine synthase (glutamine-hydrolysing)